MPALPLRLHGRSSDIRDWGAFLKRRQWRTSLATDLFDDETEAGTRAFQMTNGLSVTGEVDQVTWDEGVRWGLQEYGIPETRLRSLTMAQREAVFGKFNYRAAPVAGNPEAIWVDPAWVAKNIVSRPCPQLEGKRGFPKGARVSFHAKVIDPFLRLIAAWESAGLLDRIVSFDGTYAPRFRRGSQSILSNHANGSAFDICAAKNPMGVRGAPLGAVGCVYELVPLAEQHGFAWGNSFKDDMHFELVTVP